LLKPSRKPSYGEEEVWPNCHTTFIVAKISFTGTVYFALFTVYVRGGVGWKRHMGGEGVGWKVRIPSYGRGSKIAQKTFIWYLNVSKLFFPSLIHFKMSIPCSPTCPLR